MLSQILSPVARFFPENNRLERIWLLAKVDFKKRYYESILGLFWAFMNPLFKVAVYWFAFTYLMGNKDPNFGFYLFLGLLIWLFFGEVTNKSMKVFKSKKYLIENIQFNKMDLFYSLMISSSIGFLFNFSAYYVLSMFKIPFYTSIVWLPILVSNLIIVALGVGLILACLSLYIKDLEHVWTMVLQAGFWTAPILFRGEAIMEKAPFLLYINPVSGLIINVRHAIFYGTEMDWFMFVYNFAYGFFLLAIGLWLFRICSPQIIERL